MSHSKQRFAVKTSVFITIELLLCVILLYLLYLNLEVTSNLSRDILIAGVYYIMAATLPVWIFGFFHLRSVNLLRNYPGALTLSLGFTLMFTIVSIVWNLMFIITFFIPVIIFNFAGLRQTRNRS